MKRREEDRREKRTRWERKGGEGEENGNSVSFIGTIVRVKWSWYQLSDRQIEIATSVEAELDGEELG